MLSLKEEAKAKFEINIEGCTWCLWDSNCCQASIVLWNSIDVGGTISELPTPLDFPTPPPAGSKFAWIQYFETQSEYPINGTEGTFIEQEIVNGTGIAYVPTQLTRYNSTLKGIAVYYFDSPQN